MRLLKFIVNKQVITLDPDCDLSGLIPGSEAYLEAQFVFSSEWNDCVKVASFWSALGREYEPQIINKDSRCRIPVEALAKRVFKVQVVGQNSKYKLITNKVEVVQRGGSQ